MAITRDSFYRSASDPVDQAETDATLAKLTGQAPAERGGPPKPGGGKDGRLAGNAGGKGKTLKKGRKTPAKK